MNNACIGGGGEEEDNSSFCGASFETSASEGECECLSKGLCT